MDVEKDVGGLSAFTDVLGDVANQFECHAASRGIDQIEQAGRVMRAAKDTIEQLRAALERIALNVHGDIPAQVIAGEALRPNIEVTGAPTTGAIEGDKS